MDSPRPADDHARATGLEAAVARLLARVTKREDGCWYWPTRYLSGYGRVTVDGQPMAASRAMWIALHGPIAPGLFVCHECDCPPCIRPSHLFIGTHSDNVRDYFAKRRAEQEPRRTALHDRLYALLTEAPCRAWSARELHAAAGYAVSERDWTVLRSMLRADPRVTVTGACKGTRYQFVPEAA